MTPLTLRTAALGRSICLQSPTPPSSIPVMLSFTAKRCLHTSRRRSAIQMPAMSPWMTEGTVTKWFKKEGETFNQGDILLEIESDIARINVEALNPGILGKILIPAGSQNIPVEQALALVAKDQDELSRLQAAEMQAAPPSPHIPPRSHLRSHSLHQPSPASGSSHVRSQSLLQPPSFAPSPRSPGHLPVPPRPRSPNLPSLSLLSNAAPGSGQVSQHVRGMYSASVAQSQSSSQSSGPGAHQTPQNRSGDAEAGCEVQNTAANVRRTIVSNLMHSSKCFESLL
ncbi:hypothetical protein HGRIS_013590 [Hohenbuehelia grisea]|uniref:Lipoyl-binding domain-containing protein n=1 Tax=Hohenbuehelia grisea TaxID=104357 RepID=A0ABR3IW95_9AGAR